MYTGGNWSNDERRRVCYKHSSQSAHQNFAFCQYISIFKYISIFIGGNRSNDERIRVVHKHSRQSAHQYFAHMRDTTLGTSLRRSRGLPPPLSMSPPGIFFYFARVRDTTLGTSLMRSRGLPPSLSMSPSGIFFFTKQIFQ